MEKNQNQNEVSLSDYQRFTKSTAQYPSSTKMPTELVYIALKLNGEAGEFAEKIGKLIRDKGGEITPEDRVLLTKELGDVAWYLSEGARQLGTTLSDVLQVNMDKLASRKARGVISGSGDER